MSPYQPSAYIRKLGKPQCVYVHLEAATHQEQSGIQCLSQGHLDGRTGGATDWTINPARNGRHTQPPEPQLSDLSSKPVFHRYKKCYTATKITNRAGVEVKNGWQIKGKPKTKCSIVQESAALLEGWNTILSECCPGHPVCFQQYVVVFWVPLGFETIEWVPVFCGLEHCHPCKGHSHQDRNVSLLLS